MKVRWRDDELSWGLLELRRKLKRSHKRTRKTNAPTGERVPFGVTF